MGDVIEIARREVGYVETPANSNKTKYGEWFGLNGVAWCGIFVSWVYAMAGKPLEKIGYTKGFAGCQTAVSKASSWGAIVTVPQLGDVIFFDWNGDGKFDHTGIFEKDLGGGLFQSIEGNTAFGNDSNGGKVMVRADRKYKNAIFVRPK